MIATATRPLASQEINTDPTPWRCVVDNSRAETPWAHGATRGGYSLEPRPEYGNEANKLLRSYRTLAQHVPAAERAAHAHNYVRKGLIHILAARYAMDGVPQRELQAWLAHAEKVLLRLASVYETR